MRTHPFVETRQRGRFAACIVLFAFFPVLATSQSDTLVSASDEEKAISEIRENIKGRENEPAGSVFKKVKIFAAVPAERLLVIMKMGYGRSLGVRCIHCHDISAWESDAKREKRAAREMAAMVKKINGEILASMSELADDKPIVNCTTCHRGELRPALQLPPPGGDR